MRLNSEVRYEWQNGRRLPGRANNRREGGRSLHSPEVHQHCMLTQKCEVQSYVRSPNRVILWPEQKVMAQGKTKGTKKCRCWCGLNG